MSKTLTTVFVQYKNDSKESFNCVEIVQSPEVYMLVHSLNDDNTPNTYTYISVSDIKIMKVVNDKGEAKALNAINECSH